jgi:hypothetical protein
MPTELPTLLNRAGFTPERGASPAGIAQVEQAFGVVLPAEFAELWALSDGMSGDGMDLLALSDVEGYAEIFGAAGYVPFADCNDSNPYAVCCREPLGGLVVHLSHDGDSQLVCRGLPRFLELVAEARVSGDVDRIEGDLGFNRPDRSGQDVATALKLVRLAQDLDPDDEWRTDVLRFAAQLLGLGQERELAEVLTLGNEYVRQTVRQRWSGLGTPAAEEQLHADTAAFREFVAELKRNFEVAGLQTEPTKSGEFRLQPGRVGLNFEFIFADCRRPGAMA